MQALAATAATGTSVEALTKARPSRKPLPAYLPRERVVMAAPAHCPCCGSDRLSNVTETLEVVPRRWKVVQTVRERFACRACETVTQPLGRSTSRHAACSDRSSSRSCCSRSFDVLPRNHAIGKLDVWSR